VRHDDDLKHERERETKMKMMVFEFLGPRMMMRGLSL